MRFPIESLNFQLKNGSDDMAENSRRQPIVAVLGHVDHGNGMFDYKLRWKGYGEDHDTWQTDDKCDGCAEEVIKYWIQLHQNQNHVLVQVQFQLLK